MGYNKTNTTEEKTGHPVSQVKLKQQYGNEIDGSL